MKFVFKKGFLTSENKLTPEMLSDLRQKWNEMYANTGNTMMILNKGITFHESSNTSVEMQLNENKQRNNELACQMFGLSSDAISGQLGEDALCAAVKAAVVPVITAFENALDRGLLLPSERDLMYFAFDTNELLKGDVLKRYQAYKTGLECNVLQIDEARYKEDLTPLGLNWIKLGLQDVLYDPKTKMIYTPNMNQSMQMSENTVSFGEKTVDNGAGDGIIEKRDWITKNGRHIYIGEEGGTGASAKGKNIFVKGFKNQQALNNHWQNGRTHQKEYADDGITTKEQYEERALELAESACSDTILGYKNAQNEIVRYDTEKNDFVKGNPNKCIKTMFKPEYEEVKAGDKDAGLRYFKNLMEKEGVKE